MKTINNDPHYQFDKHTCKTYAIQDTHSKEQGTLLAEICRVTNMHSTKYF